MRFSKRRWDGLIRKWRRQLHEWDPQEDKKNNKSDSEDDFPKIERLTTNELPLGGNTGSMEEDDNAIDDFDDSDLKDML